MLVGAAGFEPAKPGSKPGVLPLNYAPFWLGQKDSNLQHAASETAALPVELCPKIGDSDGIRTHIASIESRRSYAI